MDGFSASIQMQHLSCSYCYVYCVRPRSDPWCKCGVLTKKPLPSLSDQSGYRLLGYHLFELSDHLLGYRLSGLITYQILEHYNRYTGSYQN